MHRNTIYDLAIDWRQTRWLRGAEKKPKLAESGAIQSGGCGIDARHNLLLKLWGRNEDLFSSVTRGVYRRVYIRAASRVRTGGS
jgi:hypothetical protein